MLEITITSAVALTSAHKGKLEQALHKKYEGQELAITYKIDDSLIAGLQVNVAGQLYDPSLRSRLEQLATSL